MPLAACYTLHPYQPLLSLGSLAEAGSLLSKVDKEKCNSGLMHAFIKIFFNFLTPFQQTSQCSHSPLAHRASSKMQFL